MTRTTIYHALGLHMHQPPGNLDLLIEAHPREAEEIIRCYERPARYALKFRDVACFHVGFSGILLEQLLEPRIVDRYRHILDIPQMLDRYREADNIELIGMGYYHPIFPLIPRADWVEQLTRGREVMRETFGRAPKGFWPPEMAFSMEMIPALIEAGYDYVVVDGVHVRPEDGISDVFRLYVACQHGVCITVVPRDRVVSNAQAGGLNPGWFENEVRARVDASARPEGSRLVTTWSDGENGGWFRQTHEESGFFGHFFSPYMEHVRSGDYPITPVVLGDYLKRVSAPAEAQVQTGAWNVGGNSGLDLSQWAGSDAQRAAVAEVIRLSVRYWALRDRLGADGAARSDGLVRARRLILEAETSCFLFWGDSWIPHLYERTRPADAELAAVAASMDSATAPGLPLVVGGAQATPPALAAGVGAAVGGGKPRSKERRGGGAKGKSKPFKAAKGLAVKASAAAGSGRKRPVAESGDSPGATKGRGSRRGRGARGAARGGAVGADPDDNGVGAAGFDVPPPEGRQ